MAPEEAGDVLVVEDEPTTGAVYESVLRSVGFEVTLCEALSDARRALSERTFDAIFSDIRLGGDSGLDLLAEATGADGPPVVMVTASREVGDAISALRRGAFDYLLKPLEPEVLLYAARRAVERGQMARELKVRRAMEPERPRDVGVFVSAAMNAIVGVVEQVKNSSVPVLILGEPGTGKEVVARLLHRRSARSSKPFVAVNCGALPSELIESTLFGHVRGAFTGAHEDNPGHFRRAHGGILFLDEIGELPLPHQTRLLRVLQENEVTPVGGQPQRVDVRVVAATNRSLEDDVKAGRFRADLYYRLNVIPIEVPPLRERRESIAPLAAHLLDHFVAADGLPTKRLAETALAALERAAWPGNVRELENVLKRAALLSPKAEIGVCDLGEGFAELVEPESEEETGLLDAHTADLMLRALAECRGNVSQAARRLGIGRATFYRRAKRYGIDL